jgi:hypothetical protein
MVMTASIQLTFDGGLVRNNHNVTMRDLAQAMIGLQAAADRACLDVFTGNVWKYQKLPKSQYEIVEFIVGEPQEGSFLIDFLSERAMQVIERIQKAMREPYAQATADGDNEIYTIGHQIEAKKDVAEAVDGLMTYEQLKDAKNPLVTRSYGDKSINKEIAQMLIPLGREPQGYMKIVLKSSEDDPAETYEFDYETARRFKRIIGTRRLGHPAIYEGIIRELDRGTNKIRKFKGKFINASNQKTVAIHIEDKDDFSTLIPYLDQDEPFKIIASPIIEFDSFDPVGGDIQFLRLHHGG